MSNAILAEAWPLAMSPTDKAVLIAMADAARDPDDRTAPRQTWLPMIGRCGKLGLADRTCLSDRAIRAAVGRLAAAGHIRRDEVPGKGVRYTVHPGTSCRADTGSGRKQTTETPEPRSAKASAIIPQKATPSSDARDAGGRSAESITGLPDLPAGTLPASWHAFVEMRVAMTRGPKPRPWTPGAAAAARRKLAKLAASGNDPNAMLEQSVLEGWAGVWPVNRDGGRRRLDRSDEEGPTMRAMRRVMARQTPQPE